MTFSTLIDQAVTPHASVVEAGRAGVAVDRIVLHHGATTSAQAILDLMTSGSRTVSSTYVVANDGETTGVVAEEDTPFTNGDLDWNRRSITVEVANEAAGDASGWPVSAAASERTAMLVADVAGRLGIPIDRDRVLGHGELFGRFGAGYATACPGGLDVDAVVARAVAIAGGDRGTVPVDGVFGTETIRAVQRVLARTAPEVVVDGDWGPQSVSALQRSLGVVVDGRFGPQTVSAWQGRLGQAQDGQFGPVTIRALQSVLVERDRIYR